MSNQYKYDFWIDKERDLSRVIDEYGIDKMLEWGGHVENVAITNVMENKYKFLKDREDWEDIKKVIQVPIFGEPPTLPDKILPNLVKQYCRIIDFQEKAGLRLSDMDSILELGPNYGALSLLINRLGFSGEYSLYELEEYLQLCKHFLGYHGYENINYLHKTQDLKKNYSLFISMFALAECPTNLRDIVLNINYDVIWLGYRKTFMDHINNYEYFDDFQKERTGYDWIQFNDPLSYESKDRYLIGIKKKLGVKR